MKIIKSLISLTLFSFMLYSLPVLAQENENNYLDNEKKQDQIETLYVEAHNIMDDYPEVTYTYVYEDGNVTSVNIEGISDNRDKRQLEVHLIDMERLKKELFNQPDRMGVYYVTETSPEPKNGYRDFYSTLQSNLEYPESAEDEGVEGTVYVKFIVDPQGDVAALKATEDIEAPSDWIVQELKQEAKNAVEKTSGAWNPATVGGVPVSEWVMVPVQFKLESPYFRPILY